MTKIIFLAVLFPGICHGQTLMPGYVFGEGGGVASSGGQTPASRVDIAVGQASQGEASNPGGSRIDFGYYSVRDAVPPPQVSSATAKLALEPRVLNIRSKGEYISAKLRLEREEIGCFNIETIAISAIDGRKLEEPIYSEPRRKGTQRLGKDHKKDKEKNWAHPKDCAPVTMKFDRKDVIEVLPANAKAKVTVSGELEDGRVFAAEDSIRTIDPRKWFRLGKVLVTPNPVTGGKAPVFHIECGVADRITIKVINLAGMVVHEHTLLEAPELRDDEEMPVSPYEYTWGGRVAPGMYYFTVEAEREGEVLKANGRFVVTRQGSR